MNDDIFYALSLEDRMDAVNERLGGIHPDRICTVQGLMDLIGETVYLVLSPFGQEQDIGNGFIYEWGVGPVTTVERNPIEAFDGADVDNIKLVCEFFNPNKPEEYTAISIKDFNVIPNNHNNHCMFSSRDGVEAYAIYRKLKWQEDENLTEIKDEYDFWMVDDKSEDKKEN